MMEQLRDAVAGELARFGAAPGLAAIVDAWPQAVGPEIARNAWPARLSRDGTLVLHTSSAAWAFELAHLAQRIRGLLPRPAPAKLRFIVGPLPEPTRDSREPHREVVQPSAAELERAAALAASIRDEKLRKVVAKTAALSFARAASDRPLWYYSKCPQAAGLQGFFYE